jgi:hypothetical protein
MIIPINKSIIYLFFTSFCLMSIDSFPYFPISSIYRPMALIPLILAFSIYIVKMKVRPFFVFLLIGTAITIYHTIFMSVLLEFPLLHIVKAIMICVLFFIMMTVFNKVFYINRFDFDIFLHSLGRLSFYVLILMFVVGFIQIFFPTNIASAITNFFSYRSVGRLQMMSGEPSQMVRHLLFYMLFFIFFYHGPKKKMVKIIGVCFLLMSGSTYGYITILVAVVLYIILFKFRLLFSPKKILSFILLASSLYFLYLNVLDDYTLAKINGVISIMTSSEGISNGFLLFIQTDSSAFQRIMNPVIGFMSGSHSFYLGVGLGGYVYIYPHFILEYFPFAANFDMVVNVLDGSSYITSKSLYSRIYAELGAVIFVIYIFYLCLLYVKILNLKKQKYFQFLSSGYVLLLVLVLQGDSIIFLNYFFLISLLHVMVFSKNIRNNYHS